MKRKLRVIVFVAFSVMGTAFAQTKTDENSVMEKRFGIIELKQKELDVELQQLSVISNRREVEIQNFKQLNEALCQSLDSIKNICDSLKRIQTDDRTAINDRIQDTNDIVFSNQSVVENRTMWGGLIAIIILVVLLSAFFYFTSRIKKGRLSIDEVRGLQDKLQNAQAKMQEESIRLDNKLLEIIGQQIKTSVAANNNVVTTDHSLALKVADEIVRIELNLSRMDSSIKGYKQLAKAVQRIKDNFQANGYEIVDMLGKPYNDGMKVVANFVTDETLEQGRQIITGIIKPQINYNGKMIQSAQITVSQNI